MEDFWNLLDFSRRPLNRINHRGDSIAQGVYHIVVQN